MQDGQTAFADAMARVDLKAEADARKRQLLTKHMSEVRHVADVLERLAAAGNPGLTTVPLFRWKDGWLGGRKRVEFQSDPCWYVGRYDWQRIPWQDSTGELLQHPTYATPDRRLLHAPPNPYGAPDDALSGLTEGYPFLVRSSDYRLVAEALERFLGT